MDRKSVLRDWRVALALLVVVVLGAALAVPAWAGGRNANPGLFFVDFRDVSGGQDGVALIDLNPDSPTFGNILQRVDLGAGVLPHHLYFNQQEQRLYTTALGGARLYELKLRRTWRGEPRIQRVVPIDAGPNQVGEDMYFTEDGKRFYMTFMGGTGGINAGSVGVFDARTNRLIETIEAPMPANPAPGAPFLLHPHGITANEALGKLLVTSTLHPDGVSEPGNTIAEIDLATNEVIRTHLVSHSPAEPSVPVEVLMLRGGLAPYVLVSTTGGGDVWLAPYDEQTGAIGQFVEVVDGEQEGLGVALEFYVHTDHHGKQELYVSFAVPGVVKVYDLEQLPEMAAQGKLEATRTFEAEPGAHHMAFFETAAGRELLVVQNNLLDIPGINAGSLTVIDLHDGATVATLDLATKYGIKAESVESALGHGADLHH
jgi:DNA-binding beta-propeller fold protein YncE